MLAGLAGRGERKRSVMEAGEAAEVGVGDGGGGGGGEDGAIPRDARVVKALLKSMGVEEYEPRVIHQFLELWYRYVVDVLSDAQIYSEHASKPSIDVDDVKLAIQTKVNSSFSQPPPREVLMELARNRNKIPLPKSIAGPGLPLPPEQDTLISTNYQLFVAKNEVMAQPEEEDDEEDTTTAAATTQTHDQQQQQHQLQLTQKKVSFPLPGTKRSR